MLIQTSPDVTIQQVEYQLENPTLKQVLALAESLGISKAAERKIKMWADVAAVQQAPPVQSSSQSALNSGDLIDDQVTAIQSRRGIPH